MGSVADELRFFLTAVGYFTRVPMPQRLANWVGFAPHYLNAAARYFPLVGLLVGLAGAVVTGLAWQFWSPSVSIVLGMAATLMLTGAFHEDGLADCVDAFGGGYRPEDVLAIMRDSRVGAFGAIAIVVALLLKWQLLVSVEDRGGAEMLLAILIAAHGASRAMAITFLATHDYVRAEGKAKPVAQRLETKSLLFALACGVLPLLWISPLFAGIVVLVLAGVRAALGAYFVRRIGGYTGDCLGMAQQLAELSIYLVAAAWKWY